MKLHMTTDFTVTPNFIFLSETYSYFAVVFFHFTCLSLQYLNYAAIAAIFIPYWYAKIIYFISVISKLEHLVNLIQFL